MDSKKTNLTPELKEIYDRVMNTSGKPVTKVPSPQVSAQPAPAAAPAVPNPLDSGLTADPPPSPAHTPAAPQATAMPAAPAPPTMPTMPSPESSAMPEPTPAEQALANTPARPLSEGNTFAFNGTAKNPIKPSTTPTTVTTKKKAKISLPVIIVLGVVFIVAWGIFWAIALGLIQR